ncbi:hypothetical protein LINGRAHAP2_LOCUS27190, partial [Linum grandiflorum]
LITWPDPTFLVTIPTRRFSPSPLFKPQESLNPNSNPPQPLVRSPEPCSRRGRAQRREVPDSPSMRSSFRFGQQRIESQSDP